MAFPHRRDLGKRPCPCSFRAAPHCLFQGAHAPTDFRSETPVCFLRPESYRRPCCRVAPTPLRFGGFLRPSATSRGRPSPARRSDPKPTVISSILQHPEQRQSDQSAESGIASLHHVHDRIVAIAEGLDIKPKFRNCDSQPATLKRPEVGIRPYGLSPTQDLHGRHVQNNCAGITGIDKEFQLLSPAVCGYQLQAKPRSCRLAAVNVSLFHGCFRHWRYKRMKTSSE
jgi:hypothetical protein